MIHSQNVELSHERSLKANRFSLLACLILLLVTRSLYGEEFQLKVDAGKYDRENTVCRVELQGKDLQPGDVVRLENPKGELVCLGDVVQASLLSKSKNPELIFVLPQLAADKSISLTVKNATENATTGFQWIKSGEIYTELRRTDRPVLRYMHEALDETTASRRAETYKVYHHVFNPAGETLLTKGAGGLFPHHRGLFYGFNKITYGENKKADIWHCTNGVYQSHEEITSEHAGSVAGRHRLRIDWHGQDGQVFAEELRELTCYAVDGGMLIEFASRLESKDGKLTLDGDPQHAGFQFRASQHVPDKTKQQTYYLRPDGKGEPGKFRNWPADKTHANLPWNALSMVIDDQRYTVCYIDRPENPKESRFSERDYGRFGSYFKTEIADEQTLDLNYRIWVQAGEMDVNSVQRIADDLVHPPTVTLD